MGTEDEQQALRLIEYASLRLGEPILQASSIDDLDDRLDALAESTEALYLTSLLARHAQLFRTRPLSTEPFAESVGERLGAGQRHLLDQSKRVLDAWLDAQRQLISRIAFPAPERPGNAESALSFSLTSPTIPAEIAELVFHGWRAGFCMMAMLRAIITEATPEPWLGHALVERLVRSAAKHLRLLASLPGVLVDEAIVPPSDRLDLLAIDSLHKHARETALRAFPHTKIG